MAVVALSAASLGANSSAGTAAPAAVITIPGTLSAVSIVPGTNVDWAVGDRTKSGVPSTLILRGTSGTWARVPAPSPAEAPTRNAVSAASATNAWAVGQNFPRTGGVVTVTLRWNGTSWFRVASPTPGGQKRATLTGVAAISVGNAWAVGSYCPNTGCSQSSTLVLHWDGSAWTQQLTPSPNKAAWLTAVDATSANDVWAVGYTFLSTGSYQTLILHWDGTSWRRVTSPTPSGGARLSGITITSAGTAWAVGTTSSTTVAAKTVILQWTGTAWVRVVSPNPSSLGDTLTAVDATSTTNAWAVGWQEVSGAANQTLTMHWDGTSWTAIQAPTPGTNGGRLYGVAASSAKTAWAVGCLTSGCPVEPSTTLLLHWDGTAWTQS